MDRTLELRENGVKIVTLYRVHNDRNGSGLNDDLKEFIKDIESKKQVKVFLSPSARELGRQVGSSLRKEIVSNLNKLPGGHK